MLSSHFSILQTSKANDSSTSSNEENDFLGNDLDDYSVSSFDVESVVAMGKDVELQPSNCCETFEGVEMKEKVDDVHHDEPNNNVRDSVDNESEKIKSYQRVSFTPYLRFDGKLRL